MAAMHLLSGWSELGDGLVVVVQQGKCILDARRLSDESESLYVVDVYMSIVEPELTNVTYLSNYKSEHYTLSASCNFGQREDMLKFILAHMTSTNHF